VLCGDHGQHRRVLSRRYAATTVSIAAYYHGASVPAQCTLVSEYKSLFIDATKCCDPVEGDGATCNGSGGWPNATLSLLGCFAGEVDAAVDFGTVRLEIDAGRPLSIYIKWNGGGAHSVAIAGYAQSGEDDYLIIENPASNTQYMPYSDAVNNYEGKGVWTRTYLTKS
jgi:hypothetical protein